ncbi:MULTISPECIES: HEAT repeat domain-containing protein [unclassified Knoellia]|uniref:HEAT repeat domain-containing protein n=1 Tax=Knoellia altitudinis TaxID=3404795 RepID=UPI00360F9B81
MIDALPVGQSLLDEVLVAVLGLCVVLAFVVVASRVWIQRTATSSRERLAPLRTDLIAVGAGEDPSGKSRRRLVDDRVAGTVLDRALVDLLTKVRGAPAEDLVAVLRERHGVSTALRSLDAASSVRRARATRTLGLLRDPALTDDIVRMLSDRSREVRIVAARAVGAIGAGAGSEAAEAVLRAVRTRRSGPGVPATVAMQTLTRLGVEAGSAVSMGLEDSDPGVRNVAAAVAGHSLFIGCVPRLTRLAATDEDRTVRVSATEALGAVGRPEDVPAVAHLLAPEQPAVVRRAAARALGELGGTDAVAVLVSVLADEDRFLAVASASSLAQSDEGRRALRRTAQDSHAPEAARSAVRGAVQLLDLQSSERAG